MDAGGHWCSNTPHTLVIRRHERRVAEPPVVEVTDNRDAVSAWSDEDELDGFADKNAAEMNNRLSVTHHAKRGDGNIKPAIPPISRINHVTIPDHHLKLTSRRQNTGHQKSEQNNSHQR